MSATTTITAPVPPQQQHSPVSKSNSSSTSSSPNRVPSWSYVMVKPRMVHAGELRAFTPYHVLPTRAKELGYAQLTEDEIKQFSREISAAARHTRANLETVPSEIGLEHKFYNDISDSDLQSWVARDLDGGEMVPIGNGSPQDLIPK